MITLSMLDQIAWIIQHEFCSLSGPLIKINILMVILVRIENRTVQDSCFGLKIIFLCLAASLEPPAIERLFNHPHTSTRRVFRGPLPKHLPNPLTFPVIRPTFPNVGPTFKLKLPYYSAISMSVTSVCSLYYAVKIQPFSCLLRQTTTGLVHRFSIIVVKPFYLIPI